MQERTAKHELKRDYQELKRLNFGITTVTENLPVQ